MPENPALQMNLAHDKYFLDRLQYWMAKVASVVCAEDGATVHHAERRAYAASVLGNPGAAASAAAVLLVTDGAMLDPNANTFIEPGTLKVYSDISDGALFALVSARWNVLSGV